eukprot:TRINITY_DN5273_c0_g2_i1.p1 TRINITY_DN5273_c0_g2~~TRINITY_DN5273_c0_g2_i1.p1  ORF type:complete len:104 (+),score=19.48 TRINITY_DN5273_c0_g2_i1:248-559(+)
MQQASMLLQSLSERWLHALKNIIQEEGLDIAFPREMNFLSSFQAQKIMEQSIFAGDMISSVPELKEQTSRSLYLLEATVGDLERKQEKVQFNQNATPVSPSPF